MTSATWPRTSPHDVNQPRARSRNESRRSASERVVINRDFAAFADQTHGVSPHVGPPGEKNFRVTLGKASVSVASSSTPSRCGPMEGSVDLAWLFAEPVTREIDRMPAVIHQDATAGDRGIAAPIRMIRVRDGAILDAQCFNLHLAQLPDGPRSQQLGRSPDDRRVFPVVDRQIARPVSLARLRARSSSTRSNSNGFSQRTFHPLPSASSIGSPCNAGGVQISTKSISGPAASSSIVENVATPGNNSRAIWRRSSVAIDYRDDLHVARFFVGRPMPMTSDLTEPDDRASQHASIPLRGASSARSIMASAEFACSAERIRGG